MHFPPISFLRFQKSLQLRFASSSRNWKHTWKFGSAFSASLFTSVALVSYFYLKDEEDNIPSQLQVFADSKIGSRHTTLTNWIPPSRSDLLSSIKKGEEYDLLIIGGGATGVGCALEAVSRGLKVALVEKNDFSSGTSSKSTKLVHGGVRYLEKAVMGLDYEQYKLVQEALSERSTFLRVAPHLSHSMPILLPIYKWYLVPYFWAGSKAYDFIAGTQGVSSSYFMSRAKTLEAFPLIKKDGLVGAMVYYDGMHNDSRTNISIALTAIAMGAHAVNHTEVVSILKDHTTGKANGVVARDCITGDSFPIRAKGIINATGPYCDSIRSMDEPSVKAMVSPSSGVHIVLPKHYAPYRMGLLDPTTSDGRVVFVLPWQGSVIAGTTDAPTSLSYDPVPEEKDIQFILKEVGNFLDPKIKIPREDVLAAWCGIRPLIKDPNAKSTQALVRSHLIAESQSGLMTISGGKWTTYRNMAEETINHALKSLRPSITANLKLIGADTFSPSTTALDLIHKYHFDTDTAQYLVQSYGDRAFLIAELDPKGLSDIAAGKRVPGFARIVPDYPFLEAEVKYAVRHEYAQTVVDVIGRRTRLAFLNNKAALEAIPKVASIMANEANWSSDRQAKEIKAAKQYLTSMGISEQ